MTYKEDVISRKKKSIQKVNRLLESYINKPDGTMLKKADLVSYWLSDYCNYLKLEERFNPKLNPSYKRGDIIKLNFGFNIGSEQGGLHYAIVLDNNNAHISPVITVIPLTSIKEDKSIHSNSINLGNEVYRQLKLKYDTIYSMLIKEHDEICEMIQKIDEMKTLAEKAYDAAQTMQPSSELATKKYIEHAELSVAASKLSFEYEKKLKQNIEDQEYFSKIGAEISRMKSGSIALVNQITTVSKMRIFDPKNAKGVLSGVSVSAESMDKINAKLKELYVF